MKKVIKILTWFTATIIVLILVSGLITQTSYFRDWLRDFAVSELNEILVTKVSIEQIEGNLFSNLEMRNILLESGSDTIIAVPLISLSYDLFALLDNEIIVHELIVQEPRINLVQDSVGIWNINRLTVADSIDKEADILSDEASPFPYMIKIESCGLLNASAKIVSKEKLLPNTISDLNISLKGIYGPEILQINLDSLSFYTESPDLVLNKLSFDFTKNGQELLLQNLFMSTKKNKIESQAKYNPDEKQHVNISSENLDLKEFDFILPDIKLKKNPDLFLTSNFTDDSLSFELRIIQADEKITVSGQSENYAMLFDSMNNNRMTFNLDLILNNIHVHDWLEQDIPESRISGQVGFVGSLNTFSDLETKMSADLNELKFHNYSAERLVINANYNAGDAEGELQLFSKSATIDLQIDIDKLLTDPVFQGFMSVDHLDLKKLINNGDLESDLNFCLRFDGENIISPKNRMALNFEVEKSHFNDFIIDTLVSSVDITGTEYRIDIFELRSTMGLLNLSGLGNLKTINEIKYDLEIGDLQKFKDLFGADTVSSEGRISGFITGRIDSLISLTEFDLKNLCYNDLKIDSLTGIFSLDKLDSVLTMSTDLSSRGIGVGAYKIDKIALTSEYDMHHVLSEIDLEINSDLKTSFTSILIPDSIISLSLPRIEGSILSETWQGALDQLTYDTGTSRINIENLLLNCITCSENGSISAEGLLSPTGTENFHVDIAGLDLKTIMDYLDQENNIGGRFNMNLDFTGSADKPIISGGFLISDGYVKEIQVQEISQSFDYKNDKFNFDFLLNFNNQDSLTAKGYLPLHLSLTDSMEIIDYELPVKLDVKSESIPIALFLNRVTKTEEVAGTFLCDFTLENNLKNPRLNGNIQILEGLFRSPYWGIDYQDIDLKISALDDKFIIEKFHIIREKGQIDAAGEIKIDLKGIENNIIYSNMNLVAEDFYLVKHKDFEIQISADIKYQMVNDEPKISGNLEVDRSSFYLPTVMERIGYVSETSVELKPALVKARDKHQGLKNPQQKTEVKEIIADTLQPPEFLEKLEGNLAIHFPRNTWIRNPQLRVELGGDINLLMDNGEFRLKGPLKIVRGQYDLFGRRFTVIEGNIDFQGSKEINPPILLEAEYVYRTSGREKKSLVLKVSGDVNYPVITFMESNNEISQEDAISIILYGRKKDELSYGSQSDISETGGQNMVAMGLVSNIVSDQLARSVGDDLKLDVIEVNAQDNWQSANFVVGKYITDDIFLTYKREFGQSSDNNLYPETISLEYEIVKNIFFQMIQGDPRYSGYDLLFKLNWD